MAPAPDPNYDPFDGIGEVAAFARTPLFPAGYSGMVRVDECKAFPSENPNHPANTYMFVVETSEIDPATGDETGARYSQVVKLEASEQKLRMALSNIKVFVAACAKQDPSTIELTSADIWEAASEEQPLRGTFCYISTTEKPVKSRPGAVFTVHNWSPTAD